MKKIISLLAALALLMTSAVSLAEAPTPAPAEPDAAAEEFVPAEPTSLVVGNPTPMRGEFFTEMWGNATSDIDVRDLLHGYNLVMWDGGQGMFTHDPSVVSGVVVTQNGEGDHTYTLVLQDDLYYSDGTKITAWDYAFTFLFTQSPVIAEIGGTPLRIEQLVGYQEYWEGDVPYLSGVHVVDPLTLTVTLNHEYLPFFYEMGLLLCNPYPISVIAPGVTVRDDGQGVYLENIDPAVTEPVFNAELLRATVMDPETGYLSHPSVVSGPYTITAWDGVTCEFEINPYYKGNWQGERPSIQHLTYTLADNETMIGQLENGEFGLLNKVTRADSITGGIDLVSNGQATMSNYPRIGLSYFSFACEKPTVSSQAVRQAIAWCMDRDQIMADYTGNFGLRVDGWYGIGQWMYGLVMGTIAPPVPEVTDPADAAAQAAYQTAVEAYSGLTLDGLTVYNVNAARAAQLLDADGWVLNADGVREKDGVTLDLKLIYPEGNNVADTSLQKNLVDNLNAVGIKLTMEAVPMADLLTMWYKQGERDADMIYLATNFYLVFEPSVHFLTMEDGTHNWSYTNLHDEELYQHAVDMRKTEPGDVLTYMQHWIAFQQRFNEVLPVIPVYSNLYFDFYRTDLQDYAITESVTWGQAIVGAWLGEAPEELIVDDEAAEIFD